ncbi:MAG: hypothetical protein IT529_15645 [Burkholderiales bacterium]|nr:hypothetical protein [Burkholderiales bacterium]
MDFDRFRSTLTAAFPPRGLPAPLAALWHEARGDWSRAHGIVAAERTKAAARVHAYLHRKEGDSSNADYWYARARAERPRGSFEKEWEALARSLLSG